MFQTSYESLVLCYQPPRDRLHQAGHRVSNLLRVIGPLLRSKNLFALLRELGVSNLLRVIGPLLRLVDLEPSELEASMVSNLLRVIGPLLLDEDITEANMRTRFKPLKSHWSSATMLASRTSMDGVKLFQTSYESLVCQPALNIDPPSASNIDPPPAAILTSSFLSLFSSYRCLFL